MNRPLAQFVMSSQLHFLHNQCFLHGAHVSPRFYLDKDGVYVSTGICIDERASADYNALLSVIKKFNFLSNISPVLLPIIIEHITNNKYFTLPSRGSIFLSILIFTFLFYVLLVKKKKLLIKISSYT